MGEGVVGAKAAITVPHSVFSDLRSEPQNRPQRSEDKIT